MSKIHLLQTRALPSPLETFLKFTSWANRNAFIQNFCHRLRKKGDDYFCFIGEASKSFTDMKIVLLGWKSGANCLAIMTAKSASSRAWTAATSANSALPRAVDVREMAMSAFWRAILDARWAALTAASILSRNLADLMRNRCFFFCDVMSTLFLYFPSSFVPSYQKQIAKSVLKIYSPSPTFCPYVYLNAFLLFRP